MKPKLTLKRWRALKKLEGVGDAPFLSAQFDLKGPTMISLEECGWVERVAEPETETPFFIQTNGIHWRLTAAGRAAIAALPETAPPRN
jgi:DNA-binding MarR family transcriptional regulator